MLSIRRVRSYLLWGSPRQIGLICAWSSGNVARVIAEITAGRRTVINRGFALLAPRMVQRASGRSVYLCIGALGVNVRICDEGRHGCGFDPERDALFAVHGPVRRPGVCPGAMDMCSGDTVMPATTPGAGTHRVPVSPALTTDPVTASGFVPMSVTASRAVCPGSISRWLGPAVIDHAGAGDVLRQASRSYRGVGEVLAVHVRGWLSK